MFLIAGVQPRTRKGQKIDQACPHCGLAQVYERRVDHYFSLFFIPLIRVKKGESLPWCERCQQPASTMMGANGSEGVSRIEDRICRGCGAACDPEFRFCPHCGNEIQ